MVVGILIALIVLWFLGYIHIQGVAIPNIPLFTINGQLITLWSLLIFFLLVGLVSILPRPFREIAGVLFVLWVLSVLGIVIAGLSSMLVIAIIVGLVIYLLQGRF